MWNFKGTLWNSTQNILPIHWKMCILFTGENLRALRRPPGNDLVPSGWIKRGKVNVKGEQSHIPNVLCQVLSSLSLVLGRSMKTMLLLMPDALFLSWCRWIKILSHETQDQFLFFPAADGLVTQGTRTFVALVLTEVARNILVSALKTESCHDHANLVVTNGSSSCCNDDHRCH